MFRNNRGFTLAELLIVITIIGILSSIVIVNISSSRVKSRDAKRKADLKTIQTALEVYANANKGKYPVSLDELVSKGYLQELPKDPLAGKIECTNGGKKKVQCNYMYSNVLCDNTSDGQYHYNIKAPLERQIDLKACGTEKYYYFEN